ncbi:Transcriptional activator MetR [Sandaracinus amylolyticus]|uniref:Transcriptional activator MetR n=1 Tax=Sandaracinus amylolyticus TaxID=927083 RepID=A0A0F6YLH1_9BACT|nr:Transcriptional activator MetR [Sandaracinus amylolyticus]
MRDLRVVIAIAEAGTTAKAASLLHLTQPAVSRALLAAEERLGVPLFARTSRGLVPTAAGEALVSGAARVLVDLGELERRVALPATPPSRVRIVCECYTAYHWLPSTLTTLRRSLPDLDVALAVEHTGRPVPSLEASEVDVALLTTSQVPRGIEQKALFSDEIVFLVARTHPLAARRALTPDDLRAHTLITGLAPAEEGRWFMRRVFGRARPKLRFDRLPLTEAIIDVTRAGMGIAVLSEWIARPHLERGDLVAMRLASGPLRRGWRMAWRPEVADAAERLHAALSATSTGR